MSYESRRKDEGQPQHKKRLANNIYRCHRKMVIQEYWVDIFHKTKFDSYEKKPLKKFQKYEEISKSGQYLKGDTKQK